MRFAFITDELPRPGLAGHLAMNHAIIDWLHGQGHQVSILLLRPRLRAIAERYEIAPVAGIGVASWRNFVFTASLRAAATVLARSLFAALPARTGAFLRKNLRAGRYGVVDTVLGSFATPEQSAWCAGQIAKLAPDAVFADTIFRAPVLREPALAEIPSVIIAHDLFHLRHQALRSAGYSVHPSEITREAEATLLNSAKIIAAIQPEEAIAIGQMCPAATICTAPMPALPRPRPEAIIRISDRLVFVGSATLPNLDGLRWLFAEIWPRLKQACPPITLDIAGDCGAAFATLPPGVRRLGRIKNLSPILHRSALAVAPLRVGSGLKIKILDYAAHGLFTVATADSLRGFAADAEAPFIAARDADSFAQAVLAKLRKTNGDEQRALDYVTKHYSADACFSGLAAALELPGAAGAGKRP